MMDGLAIKTELEANRRAHAELVWRVECQGERFTLSRHGYCQPVKQYRKRSVITEFSRRARARRLRRIAEIDWDRAGAGTFITLTYPDPLADHTMGQRKNHRYIVHRWAEDRAVRHLPMIWRVEWLPRKSGECTGQLRPHMHLLYLAELPVSEKDVRIKWQETIGTNTYTQVRVQKVEKGRMAAMYVAKYCSKEASASYLDSVPYRNRTGRHAGERRAQLIPTHPLEVTERINDSIVKAIRGRACETLWWYDPRFDEGFTILGPEAVEMIKDFHELALTQGKRVL